MDRNRTSQTSRRHARDRVGMGSKTWTYPELIDTEKNYKDKWWSCGIRGLCYVAAISILCSVSYCLGLQQESDKNKESHKIALEATRKAEVAGWILHQANEAAIIWKRQAEECTTVQIYAHYTRKKK